MVPLYNVAEYNSDTVFQSVYTCTVTYCGFEMTTLPFSDIHMWFVQRDSEKRYSARNGNMIHKNKMAATH